MTPRIPAPPTGHDALVSAFDHVTHFTSVPQEYAALRFGAALVDRSSRLRMLFSGPKAAEALTGLLTNDVVGLVVGGGLYAAALTAKGKIIADVRVFARADDLLVDAPEPAAPGFAAMIRKFVNPRTVRYTDVSATMRTLGVFGPRASTVLASVLGIDAGALSALGPYQHLSTEVQGVSSWLALVPDLGVTGFDLFVPVEAAGALWSSLVAAGATPTGTSACDIARIEAGRPLWGTDMDEQTLAQEANLDSLGGISFTKGCYTGQETVARLHFRGHVNRYLRGVGSAQLVPRGAQLFDAEHVLCGDVRGSVVSPRLGGIAIAMVKRAVETGTALIARWDEAECAVRVTELPFD